MVEIKRKRPRKTLPAKIGSLLDVRWELKLQKEAIEKELKAVQEDIARVEDTIFLKYKTEDISGTRGSYCQASISKLIIPTAEDWDKIYTYIKKGKGPVRFDLLQKRLATRAVKERWDDSVAIPGVGKIEKTRLSITKLK